MTQSNSTSKYAIFEFEKPIQVTDYCYNKKKKHALDLFNYFALYGHVIYGSSSQFVLLRSSI